MAGQLDFNLSETPRRVALNVSQLVRVVRETLDANLSDYWVAGEVSNARLAPSNHLYFTLKDSRSAINVVMFNTAVRRLRLRLEDGMQILVRGRVSIYETHGALQFYAEELELRGQGALQRAFEQLKQKLLAEGLFDPASKRPLPPLPFTVGIVTALGGAVLRDMMRILLDRYPNLHLVLRPSPVQGVGAAEEIVRALDDLNRDARAEVIILARGGGSLEDLWPFNEEAVARAIRRSSIPVVSAIGHEVDYTMADFAADLRAPTPSAAAQLTVPIKAELRQRLDELNARLLTSMRTMSAAFRRHLVQLGRRVRDPRAVLRQIRQRLDEGSIGLVKVMALQLEARRRRLHQLELGLAPMTLRAQLVARRLRIDNLAQRLQAGADRVLAANRAQLVTHAQRLDAVSPLRVLERGYAVVTRMSDRLPATDAAAIAPGDELSIRLARGRLRAVAR